MISVSDAASYFIRRALQEHDPITHMKLQKLLYYAQGFHLALFDEPLFDAELQAWKHGPVVHNIWMTYKHCGSGPIENPDDVPELDEQTLGLLDEVWDSYGQFSAWRLRQMSHDTPPWIQTNQGEAISQAVIKSYFKELVRVPAGVA